MLIGGSPEEGVFLVPVDDPAAAVKVTRVAENYPSRITFIDHDPTP